MRAACLLLLAFLLAGCARYEFDLIEPREFSQHIGRKAAASVDRPPLEYRLQTREGRLVMNIVNTTDEPIELLGSRSFVVDSDGESHPLRGQTIAPNSFIKLILPPLRPVYRATPGFGIGFGVGFSRAYYPRHYPYHYHPYHPYYDYPRYLTAYDGSDNYYWTWQRESAIRMSLSYRRGGEPFTHDFTFRRVKL